MIADPGSHACLKRRFADARLLRSGVRIRMVAWIFFFWVCCVSCS